MKTLSTLPTIPEGWVWVLSLFGWWEAQSQQAIAGSMTFGHGFPPTTGTPPAGSTVWDPQTLDWARYQPEGA